MKKRKIIDKAEVRAVLNIWLFQRLFSYWLSKTWKLKPNYIIRRFYSIIKLYKMFIFKTLIKFSI